MSYLIDALEARLLFAVTPATVLTKQNRQDLLNGMNLSATTKNDLQADLNANQLSSFDATMLTYAEDRSNAHYFFSVAEAGPIATYIKNNVGDGGADARADELVAHMFPSPTDSTTYTINVGTNIDWLHGSADSSDPNFLHTLNRQSYWMDLSQAYRFTNDTKYSTELVNELASWSAAYPTVGLPAGWSATDQKSWLLDMSVRVEQWLWSYNQLLLTPGLSKEANTLFMFKIQQQLAYLGSAASYPLSDNRSLFHATAWLEASDMFPEYTASNATAARTLAYNAFDGQYYADGSDREQSPGYAENGIQNMLEMDLLDSKNGVTWSGAEKTKIENAINAYYQVLTPDGATPAMGDTYRTTSATLFLTADQVLGVSTWNAAKPRARDVWLFGTTVAAANAVNPNFPALTDRGTTYALTNSGNYVMRSDGTDPNAKQILFNAGPKGGTHGHLDPLNFELFGYGKPLISDPGLVDYSSSANRLWATSTPAHNTISADNANVGDMEDIGNGAPGVVVDQWDVESDHVQITAHQFGYDGLAGKPVLSRSIWYDKDGTMLILDLAEGLISHTYTTSFLMPGANKTFNTTTGLFTTTNPTGGNVAVQSLLTLGQTANRQTKFTSNTPGDGLPTAQRWYIQQSGTFVAFATLVTAYSGTGGLNESASWITTNPQPGQPIQLQLVKNGVPQTITFNPPAITRLPANGQNVGSYTDIAYDKSGNLHMVYYDRFKDILDYTERDVTTGKWTDVETIDNGRLCGSNPSIAIDANGHVGVAYTNGYAGDLKYAQFDGTEWNVQTVDSRGSTGHYPALAYSRGNGAVISYYYKTGGDLRLATQAGTAGWTIQTIDAGSVGTKDVGRFSSLVLDPDRPTASKWAIAYDDGSSGYTMYAIQGDLSGGVYNASTGYTIFQADHNFGGYVSLAFDAANRPTLSHYDVNSGDLRFVQSSGSTLTGGIHFTGQTVASNGTVGAYSAHYYDAAGKAVILYYDKSHNKLAKARLVGSTWTITSVATGGHEIHVSRFNNTFAVTNVDDNFDQVLFM